MIREFIELNERTRKILVNKSKIIAVRSLSKGGCRVYLAGDDINIWVADSYDDVVSLLTNTVYLASNKTEDGQEE